ncbi:unnamed protein product [Parnassius mnemosyne]|uniref:Peptidase aspartic putative domain-containing protein n=1 Tax=Parnassius mnemosyne TaxID=213953 RepID=A0AAV1LSS5_9NEOP
MLKNITPYKELQELNQILCVSLANTRAGVTTSSKKPDEKPSIQNHAQNSSESTLLQTLPVKINHGERSVIVRALFDSGYQRSYVKKEEIKELRALPSGKEELNHSLFGGVSVATQQYDCNNFTVYSIDNTLKFDMFALDLVTICKNVPKVNNKSF